MTAGCSDSDIAKYDDEDVAAIVRGEEITIGDLRFLFLDDQILESLDGTIKAKLAEQEVKRFCHFIHKVLYSVTRYQL